MNNTVITLKFEIFVPALSDFGMSNNAHFTFRFLYTFGQIYIIFLLNIHLNCYLILNNAINRLKSKLVGFYL